MMSDSTILACYQRASGSKTVEKRVSTIILNVYQSTGIEKEDGSRLSLENHRKLDEVRRFYNKKFEEEHDVHRNLASPEQYSRLSEKGEYQYVSVVMGIAYNPFLDSETGGAHRNHEPRGSGAAEVLDRKNSGKRRGGEREAEPGPDS